MAIAFLFTGSERRQFEWVARRFSLSLLETIAMAGELAKIGLDPAPGQGEPFEFTAPHTVGSDYLSRRNVPDPDANVDVCIAQDWSQRDAQAAQYLLDEHPSRAVALSVCSNSLAWFRFWAVRDPDPGRRARFTSEVEAYDARTGRYKKRRRSRTEATFELLRPMFAPRRQH
ncbi:hypothetical protein HU675_0011415 [Bradyrhizobium septentrionale]|uniref:hypothetical protein n=1 Tax=Bradyrhizobium septentrionale TaxID=1404411 RepID=UPI001596B03F|nr:hypothetical protein [Bradyrhizobium septentrionale]UGY27309.1 hypothetical protein HU675_0011415 [Bradyrhizobium septentrionale]